MAKDIVITSRAYKRMPSEFKDSLGFTKFYHDGYEVGISDNLNREDTVRTCVHEGMHIVITILQEKGWIPKELKGKKEENCCYLAEDIIYRLIDKHYLST